MRKFILLLIFALSANLAQADWEYWGTAPDGVTEIYKNDFGRLASPGAYGYEGFYHGALGVYGSNGVLYSGDGRSWDITNGHYYPLY